ncbi:hypothetical protein PCE1_004870 [Barthelona sp. PCE]
MRALLLFLFLCLSVSTTLTRRILPADYLPAEYDDFLNDEHGCVNVRFAYKAFESGDAFIAARYCNSTSFSMNSAYIFSYRCDIDTHDLSCARHNYKEITPLKIHNPVSKFGWIDATHTFVQFAHNSTHFELQIVEISFQNKPILSSITKFGDTPIIEVHSVINNYLFGTIMFEKKMRFAMIGLFTEEYFMLDQSLSDWMFDNEIIDLHHFEWHEPMIYIQVKKLNELGCYILAYDQKSSPLMKLVVLVPMHNIPAKNSFSSSLFDREIIKIMNT